VKKAARMDQADSPKTPLEEPDLSEILTYYQTADWTLGEEIDRLEPEEQEAASAFLDEVVRRDLDTGTLKTLLEKTTSPPWRVKADIWERAKPVLRRIIAVYERELQFEIEKGHPPKLSEDIRQNYKDMFLVADIEAPGEERLEAGRKLAETTKGTLDGKKLWSQAQKNLQYSPATFEEKLLTAFFEAAAELKLPQTYRTPDGTWISEGGEPLGRRDQWPPEAYRLLYWFDWFRVRAVNLAHELVTGHPKTKVKYSGKGKVCICPSCGSDCVNRKKVKYRSYVCSNPKCKSPGRPFVDSIGNLHSNITRCPLGIPLVIAWPAGGRPFLNTPTMYAAVASAASFSGSKDVLDRRVEASSRDDEEVEVQINPAYEHPFERHEDVKDESFYPSSGTDIALDRADTSPPDIALTTLSKRALEFGETVIRADRSRLWESYRPTPYPGFGFQLGPENIRIRLEASVSKELLIFPITARWDSRVQDLLKQAWEQSDAPMRQIIELTCQGHDRNTIAMKLGKEPWWVDHHFSRAERTIEQLQDKADEQAGQVEELFLRGLEQGKQGYCCREIATMTQMDLLEVFWLVLRLCLKLTPLTSKWLLSYEGNRRYKR